MEKNIKLIMDESRTVKIAINKEEKYAIPENNRTISADKIYEILDFSKGDHYTVISENLKNFDEPVLKFFCELFNEIINKINSLEDTTEDTIFNDNTEPYFPVEPDDIPF
jgi:hypothetical protein